MGGSEPLGADPNAGWCGEGETSPAARLVMYQSSRAAYAATWPASDVTKVLRLVISDIDVMVPTCVVLLGDAITAAVV